jgi:bacterioferritin
MGKKAIEISEIDQEKLLEALNKAYADEWLAYYQYWIGAKIVKGPMRGVAQHELEEHAEEELKHARMLVERIIQLGGTPLLKPEDWLQYTTCGYQTPTVDDVRNVIAQNLDGERCAIDIYNKLLKMVLNKDPITYKIAIDILEDELEHEEDLQCIIEDIDMMKKR